MSIDAQKLTKIASMLAQGVSESDVAEVVGLSPGRISQLKDEPAFQEIYSRKVAEQYDRVEELNEGWDTVEQKALGTLVEVMKYNRNPDFLLRAAMVANRASRRGSAANKPLDVGRAGPRVVIQLTQNFVNKLQQGTNHAARVIEHAEGAAPAQDRKRVNLLDPSAVEKMLGGGGPTVDDIADLDCYISQAAIA